MPHRPAANRPVGAGPPPVFPGVDGCCNRIRRGRPMCRPGHGPSRDPSTGGHTGPPLHEVGRCSGTNGNRRDTTPFLVKGGAGWCVRRRGVVTPPYGCATGDAKQRADVPKAWLPPAKFRSEIWGVSHGHRPLRLAGGRGTARRVVVPYGWLRRAAAIALGSGAQRSVCARGREEIGGKRSRNHPRRGHQRRTIPQSRLRHASSLCTREP